MLLPLLGFISAVAVTRILDLVVSGGATDGAGGTPIPDVASFRYYIRDDTAGTRLIPRVLTGGI